MKRFIISAIAASLLVLQPMANQASANTLSYTALGDSVAAGSGLKLDPTATSIDQLCGRSTLGYPSTVASSLGADLTNLSCSGAKADEGVYDVQYVGDKTITPQLESVYAKGAPDIITITIGANDVRWSQLLRQCYYFRCATSIDTTRSNIYLTDLKVEMNRIMYEIQRKSGNDKPVVLVNGYYNPLSDTTCIPTKNITNAEAAWIDQRIEALNDAIGYTVSRYSFATFVPINFDGHSLCSTDPWVQNINESSPFHPTEAGQQAIARANIDAYRDQAGRDNTEPYSLREKLLELFSRN